MSCLLNKLKSKYSLQNVFNFIPFNLTLRLAYGSRQLSSSLSISIEKLQKLNEIKKILRPSFDINRYFSYLDINHDDKDDKNIIKVKGNDIEKCLYCSLNNAKFSINLFIGNKGWEYVIKNIKKVKLVITPKILNYLYDEIDDKNRQNIFNILYLYRNNITELSFCYFLEEMKINFENIERIINILKNIFENKKHNNLDTNKENEITTSEINNKNHNIKSISFENNTIPSYIDIISKFWDRIDNILHLKTIEKITIDSFPFDEYQFSDIMKYISNKFQTLHCLKINDFGIHKSHYVDFNIFCSNINEQIEEIDFSNSLCLSSILSVLNLKRRCLKVLKLKLYSNKVNTDWTFLYKSLNSLEVFEIEIKENYYNDNINNMIFILNKIKKLKQLKIIAELKIAQLINFQNINNLEKFCIDLDLNKKDIELYSYQIYYYFSQFKNLKSLEITKLDTLNSKVPNLILPPKLNNIYFSNINGKDLISLLIGNQTNLIKIEELKIEDSYFDENELITFINLLICFKNLKTLSLNKIKCEVIINFFNMSEKYIFYEYIPLLFRNIPSLIELDISNNNYDEKLFKSKTFEHIRLAIPKNLISLKIFNSDISISQKTFTYLIETFGYILDLDGNYPKIKSEPNSPNYILDDDSDDENSNHFTDDIDIIDNYNDSDNSFF